MSQQMHADTNSSEPHAFLIRIAALRSAGCRSGWTSTVLAVIVLFACAVQVEADPLPVGTRVLFDKVYASNPALSQWIEGEITGYMPAQNYYRIRSTDGINYTLANDPRWVRVAGAKTAPSGTTPSQPATPPALPAPAGPYAVGARVLFDKVYATNPALSQWMEGEVTGYMPAQNYYKVRSTGGTVYTIVNDPRWIRPAQGNGPSIAPGPRPQIPAGPMPLQPATPQVPSVPAGRFTPGARVQFDRGEATIPSNGRWDSGIIVERVANNRYTIRNDNGVMYTIQDDPRWIIPAGAPLPGPRHDLQTPPAQGNNAMPPAANAGAMPPDGIYNVTNLGDLHSVGALEIRGATYRGLEVAGPFKALLGNGVALKFSGGLAGLEGARITGANYMGLAAR